MPPRNSPESRPTWNVPVKNCQRLLPHIFTLSYSHMQVLSTCYPSFEGKIPTMARGWKSKSIEQQQEEMEQQRTPRGAPIPPAEQERNRKRDGLLLSRERLLQQMQTSASLRHREMLQQSIAEIDKQLASFK